MTIYLDAIWLLNFLFDFLLLLLTAYILKIHAKKVRIIFGSLFASSIVILYFSPISIWVSQPLIKLIFSFLIIWITFGFTRFRTFLKQLLTFYFVTFVSGGGMLALHYFFQTKGVWENGILITSNGGYGDPVSWGFVLIAFPIMLYLSRKQFNLIEVEKLDYENYVDVYITFLNETIHLQGFIDSGNQLTDPISKLPVIVVNKKHMPKSLVDVFSQEDVNKIINSIGELPEYQSRLRIIPYRGVGKSQDFLIALKPDYVTVETKDKSWSTKKVLVGVNDMQVSADDKFQCILHPKLFVRSKSA